MSGKGLFGYLLLLVSMLGTALAQVSLKAFLNRRAEAPVSLLQWLREPSLLLYGSLTVAAFVCWVVALRRLELSHAYAISCCSLALVVLFSIALLGESPSPRALVGMTLILAGMILVSLG